MLLLFSVLFFIVTISVCIVFYLRKKKEYSLKILPEQKKLVHELLNDINTTRIEVLLIEENDKNLEQGNRFKGLTLFEIGSCIDTRNDLSFEEYDNYGVYIEEAFALINIPKYYDNKFMPKEIRSELLPFNTNKSEKVNSHQSPCFILSPVKSNKSITNELVKIDSEALDCWQNLKESAHSLNFVINQWLKENVQ